MTVAMERDDLDIKDADSREVIVDEICLVLERDFKIKTRI